MKLVEIKDIRPGQVWINDQTGLIHTVDNLGNLSNANKAETTQIRDEYLKSAKCRLIGKLGITHRIENNRLVEIPRSAGFQTDDVVKFKWDPRLYVINREIDFGIKKTHPDNSCFEATNDLYGSRQLVDFELKRIGIFGVSHEFVNEREVMDD